MCVCRRKFFDTLVSEASQDKSVWQDMSGGAELLWFVPRLPVLRSSSLWLASCLRICASSRTSGKKSSERSGGVEFCGIVNAAIREDDPLDLVSDLCSVDMLSLGYNWDYFPLSTPLNRFTW